MDVRRVLRDWQPDMPPTRAGLWLLVGLIAACCLPELLLEASDAGIGPPRLRRLAYDYAGFWPGLMHGWVPNYPLQPWLMFVTYGFLHGGPMHLIANMITLWSLGVGVMDRAGTRGFALVYGAAQLGGGLVFGLMTTNLVIPMVGASGALFGLAGALVAWAWRDRSALRQSLRPVVQVIGLLVAMNVVMWWVLNGQLAWQTHLGGFLAGWIAALLLERPPERGRRPEDPGGG